MQTAGGLIKLAVKLSSSHISITCTYVYRVHQKFLPNFEVLQLSYFFQ